MAGGELLSLLNWRKLLNYYTQGNHILWKGLIYWFCFLSCKPQCFISASFSNVVITTFIHAEESEKRFYRRIARSTLNMQTVHAQRVIKVQMLLICILLQFRAKSFIPVMLILNSANWWSGAIRGWLRHSQKCKARWGVSIATLGAGISPVRDHQPALSHWRNLSGNTCCLTWYLPWPESHEGWKGLGMKICQEALWKNWLEINLA